MSRSYRIPAYYICKGARPAQGKRITSRVMRALARRTTRQAARDTDTDTFVEPRNRGRAGSRDPDYGWTFFGDGRVLPRGDASWVAKLRRK